MHFVCGRVIKMSEYYTRNGWSGDKYEETKELTTTEISALIRKEIKEKYDKGYKIGVRTEYFANGSAINITVRELPFNPINPEWNPIESQRTPKYTQEGLKLLDDLESIGSQYRMSDCDGMIDYFNTNFYLHVNYDWQKEADWVKDAKKVILKVEWD